MWRNSYSYYEQDGKYYDIFTDEYVGSDPTPTKSTDKGVETNNKD